MEGCCPELEEKLVSGSEILRVLHSCDSIGSLFENTTEMTIDGLSQVVVGYDNYPSVKFGFDSLLKADSSSLATANDSWVMAN